MAKTIDTPSPAEAVGSHTLKEEVKKLLGDKTSVKVGTGVVSQVGFVGWTPDREKKEHFLPKESDRPWVGAEFMKAGVSEFDEFYRIQSEAAPFLPGMTTLKVEKKETEIAFGKCKHLSMGSLVDVFVVVKKGGWYAFAYKEVKKAV